MIKYPFPFSRKEKDYDVEETRSIPVRHTRSTIFCRKKEKKVVGNASSEIIKNEMRFPKSFLLLEKQQRVARMKGIENAVYALGRKRRCIRMMWSAKGSCMLTNVNILIVFKKVSCSTIKVAKSQKCDLEMGRRLSTDL